MPEKNNLPPKMQKILSDIAGEALPTQHGLPHHWSLTEVDALLSSVVPPAAEQNAPAPQEGARAAIHHEKEPEAAQPEEPTQENTAIRPEEVKEPKPEPDPLRLDLFRSGPLPAFTSSSTPIAIEPVVPIQSPVERPGVLLRRIDEQMTTDLSPVPRVVPAEEILQQQKKAQPPAEDPTAAVPEGQQRFPGFEREAPPENLSEEELQAAVRQSREGLANQFKVVTQFTEKMEQTGETGATPPPLEDETLPDPPFEYETPQDRDWVMNSLLSIQRKRTLRTTLLALLTLLSGGLTAFTAFRGGGAAVAPWKDNLPQLLFLVGGLFLAHGELLRGAKGVLRRAPNADSLTLMAALVTLVQTALVGLVRVGGESGHSFAPLFLFLATLSAAARLAQIRQTCGNFRFCVRQEAAARPLYALRFSEDGQEKSADALPKALYPAPLRFPAQFVRQSLRDDAVDEMSRWMLPFGVGLAGLAGVCAGFVSQSAASALSAAAAALCVCIPSTSLLALYQALRAALKSRPDAEIAIISTHAAEEYSRAAGIVVDSGDLFRRNRGRMHGWREYWQVRTDEVLLYAAAMAIASGGPLQAVFEGVVEGDHSVLPEVSQITYEDRMGLSCWIHNQKVFFGNRKLLENHSIPVALSEKDERSYEHDGRKILYLAVEKRLTAFFVVSYRPDESLYNGFRRLEQEDMKVYVCNGDPSITQDVLSRGFALRDDSIELLRTPQSESHRRRMRTLQERGTATVLHADNLRAFLRAVTACAALRVGVKRIRLFQVIGSLTDVLLLLTAVLTKQMESANSLIFIAYEAIWAAITYMICARNQEAGLRTNEEEDTL
jgi:hypothetical protein